MPMDTEGKNTGALIKADLMLSERDKLSVGTEYQRYRMNDRADRFRHRHDDGTKYVCEYRRWSA